MPSTMKWVKVNDIEWKGSTGYSEYRILAKAARNPRTKSMELVYHGYKASRYIAQGPTLEDCQIQISAWIRKNS